MFDRRIPPGMLRWVATPLRRGGHMGMRRDFRTGSKRYVLRVRRHRQTHDGRSAPRGKLRRASLPVRRDSVARQPGSGQHQRGARPDDRGLARLRRMASNDRLLRRQEVEALCGIARSTIYRLMKEGRFPQPLKIGERAVRWSEAEIVGWLASLPRATA